MPIEPTMEYLTEDMIEKVKIELALIFPALITEIIKSVNLIL